MRFIIVLVLFLIKLYGSGYQSMCNACVVCETEAVLTADANSTTVPPPLLNFTSSLPYTVEVLKISGENVTSAGENSTKLSPPPLNVTYNLPGTREVLQINKEKMTSAETNSTTLPPPPLNSSSSLPFSLGVLEISGVKMTSAGNYTYWYIPGEMLKVTCLPNKTSTTAMLKYYGENVCKVFTNRKCKPSVTVNAKEKTKIKEMYVKVENDGFDKKITCDLSTFDYDQPMNVNLLPLKRNYTFEDSISVRVNGLVLKPEINSNTSSYHFLYEYYEGEEGDIVVYATYNADIECIADHVSKITDYFTLSAIYQLNMSFKLSKQKDMKLLCNVSDGRSNYANVSVTFLYDTFEYETRLPHMSLANTLMKYKYNETLTTIGYKYPAGGFVIFKKDIPHYRYSYRRDVLIEKLSNTGVRFYLLPNYSRTKISFRYKPRNSTITYVTELYLAREPIMEKVTRTENVPNNNDKVNGTTELQENNRNNEEFIYYSPVSSGLKLVLITIFAMLLLFGIIGLVVAMVLIIRCRKARNRKDSSDMMVLSRIRSSETIASDKSEPLYETIPDHVYEDPEGLPLANTEPIFKDMSQRPPAPLPPEALEGNKDKTLDRKKAENKYIHYDTPYEYRIFRLGIPVIQFPERFRSRRPVN